MIYNLEYRIEYLKASRRYICDRGNRSFGGCARTDLYGTAAMRGQIT